MIPAGEGIAMDHRLERLSRRRLLMGAAAVGLGAAGMVVSAGVGRLPFQTPAPPPTRVFRLGYLAPSGVVPEALARELEKLGYVEDQNLILDARLLRYRSSYLQDESRLSDLAAALVHQQPDVIVTPTTAATRQARSKTSTIPIVMRTPADPVASGLVGSLERPGGNVTGITTNIAGQLLAKRLALLKAVLPNVSRVATFVPLGSESGAASLARAQAATEEVGLELRAVTLRSPDDLEGAEELQEALGARTAESAQAIFLMSVTGARRMEDLALRSGLPTMGRSRRFVEAGGLMSYGPSETETTQRLAAYVDRILQGARPADLPVEQPTSFDFAINQKAAAALGITFPRDVLSQVTAVVDQ
jgi:putative tryptophan/tyrosine transport system substrate-binding protein